MGCSQSGATVTADGMIRRASGQRLNRVGSITEEPLTKTVDGVTYIIEKSTTIATQTEALPVDNLKVQMCGQTCCQG